MPTPQDVLDAVNTPGILFDDSLQFRADCCPLGVFLSVTKQNYLSPLAKIWGAVKPKRYLAVGVLLGTMEAHSIKSTGWFPDRMVLYDIDDEAYNPRQNNLAAAYENVSRYAYFNDEITLMRPGENSDHSAPLGPYDLVYIDAEHTRDAVLNDLQFVWPSVAPGGFALVHDIDLEGHDVGAGYDEFVYANQHDLEHAELHDPTVAYGLGIIRKSA